MDVWHAVLGAALVVALVLKLRTQHRRRFHVTVVIEREGLDTAESGREKAPEPEGPGA